VSDEVLDPARALREAFDAGFAAPPAAADSEGTALLAIRVAGEPLALPLRDIAGLLPARPILPVPGGRAELLGICGLRGALLPVYGLARLLGRGDAAEPPRWFALAAAGAGGERIALAFAAFEGYLVAASADLDLAAQGTAGAHVAAVARLPGAARPVLAVASLVRAITGTHGTGERG
jgi:chemotaxis signal transduction protein